MNIKKIVASIGGFFSNLFKNTIKELDTVILPVAEGVTNALKAVIDGDASDLIGGLIAGAGGRIVEDKLRAIIDAIVPKLQLAQAFVKSGDDPATILAKVVGLLGNAPGITKTAFYIEFSGMVAAALADGQMTLAEANTLSQYYYHNGPNAIAAAAAGKATGS